MLANRLSSLSLCRCTMAVACAAVAIGVCGQARAETGAANPSTDAVLVLRGPRALPSAQEAVSGLGLLSSPVWQETPANYRESGRSIVPPVTPFAFSRISSGFGLRSDPLLGSWRSHAGIDLPGVTGTAIHATHDGRVSHSGYAGGYGLLVRLDHGQGVESLYGHLSGLAVRAGAPVYRGQLIGYLGSTGRSTGPHLHFEVRQYGRAADPLLYLATGWGYPLLKAPEIAPVPVHISSYARQRADATKTGPANLLPGSL